MPNLLSRALRKPWGFPLVVAVAVAGFVATELMHGRSLRDLEDAYQSDQLIRQATLSNYYALDRVNSLRAYLLQPGPQWEARYREADVQLTQSVAAIVGLLERNSAGRDSARELTALFKVRTADLDRGFALAQARRNEEALAALHESDASGRGVALRSALLQAVRKAQAHSDRADARTLASAGMVRLLMHALIAAMLLSAYVLWRQTRLLDRDRREQALALQREVAARTADLKQLAGHLISTREDERARLARELHDEMGGLLSTVKLDLARLRRNKASTEELQQQIDGVSRRVSEVVEIKRRVIENLRPSALDHLGLVESLQLLCRDNARALEVPTHVELEPIELAPELELTIYRLVQEALTNVRKYSHARNVWVRLETVAGAQVRVSVEDDGIGFEEGRVGPGHHGLAGMRLRVESQGGSLQAGRRAEGGARVQALLPLRARATPEAPDASA